MKKIAIVAFLLFVSVSAFAEKYVIEFELKQSHITLDLSKHLKDAMNKITFQIPVDKEFFDSVSIGDKVVDNFRVGSAILYGSFGSWKMTVKNKTVFK